MLAGKMEDFLASCCCTHCQTREHPKPKGHFFRERNTNLAKNPKTNRDRFKVNNRELNGSFCSKLHRTNECYCTILAWFIIRSVKQIIFIVFIHRIHGSVDCLSELSSSRLNRSFSGKLCFIYFFSLINRMNLRTVKLWETSRL